MHACSIGRLTEEASSRTCFLSSMKYSTAAFCDTHGSGNWDVSYPFPLLNGIRRVVRFCAFIRELYVMRGRREKNFIKELYEIDFDFFFK